MPAQNVLGNGFPDDWTHHHVVFSNPGTLQEAIKNGSFDRWIRIVNDPRYQIQQMKRTARATPPGNTGGAIINTNLLPPSGNWPVLLSNKVPLLLVDTYAAKYTFTGNEHCPGDFVVFPTGTAGNVSNQANVVGLDDLYIPPICLGANPTVKFAYFVGTGIVQTSPVLSLDGTKVAFVESSGTSVFHVLTIATTGSNGTAFNVPAVPGTGNNAVDTKITMNGNVNVTRSSPYVDYEHDVAYVGDDTGKLHKFTGVFLGTPAEAGSPWPVTVNTGIILTGPTYDSISGNIFVGGSGGNLWCETSVGVACSPPNVLVGSGPNGILDAPIVDSTVGTVFATAQGTLNSTAAIVLSQVTTAMASQVIANMGAGGGAGQHNYDGAFDGTYFSSVGSGHMYFCGNDAMKHPLLLRVGFSATGTMNSSPDPDSFSLASATVDCTPLTESLHMDTATGPDYLFVGIYDKGFSTGTSNCNTSTCVASFVLPTSSPFTFPTAANATNFSNALLGKEGMSGFNIDNVSPTPGASNIYFVSLHSFNAAQLSQKTLQ
jgi:hypothetical protein